MGYVDPFIGTGGDGHTFPAQPCPAACFSSAPIPVNRAETVPRAITTRTPRSPVSVTPTLSGTGTGDLCDVLVTPTQAGAEMPGRVVSPFSHEKEKASPGYYSVDLQAFDIQGGTHRHPPRRPAPVLVPRPATSRQPAVSLDLGFAINGDEPVETRITLEGPTTISGYRFSKGWAKHQ